MGFMIVANPGVAALERSLSGPAVAPAAPSVPAEADGLFGDPGTAEPVRSGLNPGAPNINPSNALAAVDALLFGFTPTHAVAPPAPLSAPQAPSISPSPEQPASTQTQKLDAVFGVGTAPTNPSVNLLA
ncbi:MAG: hypothetical protein LAP39_00350 [Acidobacteriia bacterium]|nr:hypothetical protein [Terriglobia bacterium]